MFAATAATLPFATATSRTALILFLGSMTWPPFQEQVVLLLRRDSVIEQMTRQIAPLPWFQSHDISPIIVLLRAPFRREVFALSSAPTSSRLHIARKRKLNASPCRSVYELEI